MSLKDLKGFILQNTLVKKAYKFKFYLDLGINNVSWFTSKLPEITSAGVIVVWLGVELSPSIAAVCVVGVFACLYIIGYFLKNSGLFDTEQYIVANKNPVQNDLLDAARLIKAHFKPNKKYHKIVSQVKKR